MKHVLSTEDMQIAKWLMGGDLTDGQIAAKMGLNRRTIVRRKSQPEMVEYMDAIRAGQAQALEAGIRESVKEKAREETKAHISTIEMTSITPLLLIERLWELARLSPNETKGNIIGQQAAVDSIWTKLGFKGDAPRVEDMQPEKPKFYRSEWMDEKPN